MVVDGASQLALPVYQRCQQACRHFVQQLSATDSSVMAVLLRVAGTILFLTDSDTVFWLCSDVAENLKSPKHGSKAAAAASSSLGSPSIASCSCLGCTQLSLRCTQPGFVLVRGLVNMS